MAISLSTVSAIAAREGNDRLEQQLNMKSKIRSAKGLKTEQESGVRVVNTNAGALGSAAISAGSQTLPTAENVAPVQLLVRPVSLIVHAKVPIDAAEMVNGKKDAINLVSKSFQDAGDSLGVLVGRGVFDGYCSVVESSASITSGAGTISVTDISAFRVNLQYDQSTDGSTLSHRFRVASIVRDGDGTGSIVVSGCVDSAGSTFTGSLTGGSGIWLQGFFVPSAGFRLTSLADACGSADLYGTTVSSSDWSGTDTDLSDHLSDQAMRELADDIGQRSDDPNVFASGRLVFQDFEDLQVANRRYMSGDSMDPYGKNALKPLFRDSPYIVDDLCPARSFFAWRDDAFLLGIWREAKTLQNNTGTAEVSQTTLDYLIKVLGMYNGVVDRRNAIGRLKNITIVRGKPA